MAKEKLTMVTLSGPVVMVDTALQRLVVNREFHPVNAAEAMRAIKRLYPFKTPNPYSEPLKKAFEVMEIFKSALEYRGFEGLGYTAKNTAEYFDELHKTVFGLRNAGEALLAHINENETIRTQLDHLHGINERLADLFEMKYVELRFGRIPVANYEDLYESAEARSDAYLIRTGEDESWIYGIYFALPGSVDQADAIFGTNGFERIRLSDKIDPSATPDEMLRQIETESGEAREKYKEIEFEIQRKRNTDSDELFARYSHLRLLSEAFELRSFSGHRNEKFFIVGWIPDRIANEYADECSKFPEFGCVLTKPKKKVHFNPPIKSESGFLVNIFSPFLKMYGLPSYYELDPTLFTAVTYILIFGIMFGDSGQGAVLCLVGFLMWKKKHMWMGRIIICTGFSSVIFGFVYGSFFGFEHILPGFKVLENGNALIMLAFAAGAGAVLILMSMIFNIVNGIMQNDVKKALFSPNGLSGFVLYGGIVAGAVLRVLSGKNIFTPATLCFAVVLPLMMIFFADPLTKLIHGKKNVFPGSVGGFLAEGFFELFETALAYVSNTVSFLRIGAFAISHAGMMSVVFLLTGDGSNIIGLIIGNVIVTGIEAVLVCIQVMRLEFYELFGRFYSAGGEVFTPHIIAYETVNLH